MPEKNNLAVITISLTAILTVLCVTETYASNKNDYENFPSVFRTKDDQTENLLQFLLFPTSRAQPARIQRDHPGVINPFLSSDYVNEGTFYPLMDYETYSIEASPDSADQILSVNKFKADDTDDEYAKPSLTMLLKVIDQLKVPEFRSFSKIDEKREWNGKSAFETLMDASSMLGRLNGGDSKTESRRFHSWGG